MGSELVEVFSVKIMRSEHIERELRGPGGGSLPYVMNRYRLFEVVPIRFVFMLVLEPVIFDGW